MDGSALVIALLAGEEVRVVRGRRSKGTEAAPAAPPPPPPLLKPPFFSTATLGGMAFAHVTKGSAFNATDLALLRKYPLVQFDKSQDEADMPWSTLEDRFIAAARQIKSVNANVTTLMYDAPTTSGRKRRQSCKKT